MRIKLIGMLALAFSAACLLQSSRAGEKKNDPPREIVIDGELTTADLRDKVRQQMYCKTYTFKMVEGRNYQIDMRSGAFDSYLRLENAEGVQVAFDDDGGGFPSARILYRAPKTGDYTIICTTFGANSTGKYTMTVKDPGGPAPREEKKEEKKEINPVIPEAVGVFQSVTASDDDRR